MKKYIMTVLCILLFIVLVSCSNSTNHKIATVRLNIQTYLAGKDQVTHPSVISFKEPWNGYKYWMAYTPYPFANGEEENPSIAVSNDMYYWDTSYGMVNPIANNEETGCNELKDPHILYREDVDRIEIWYLGRVSKNLGGDGTSLTLLRKYSYDGIIWSEYEVMSTLKYLSPTIIWREDKYCMWAIGYSLYNTEKKVVYQESVDGKNWTRPVYCSLDGSCDDWEIWHGAVTAYDNEYHFVYIDSMNDAQEIKYCKSSNGIDFKSENILLKNESAGIWKRLYRPALLVDDNRYYLFYGVINAENENYITLSSGNSMENLIGIRENDVEKMKKLDTIVTDTSSIRWKINQAYKLLKKSIRPELFAVAFPVILIMFACKKILIIDLLFLLLFAFFVVLLTLYIKYNHYKHTMQQ